MRTLLLLPLLSFLFAATSWAQRPTVSLIQLIANPEKFDGQVVRFHGVANIEFEGNAVFLSKEHQRHMVTSCALWLDLSEELEKEREWANGRYVVLEGTFDRDDRGHMGLFMGALTNIKLFINHEPVPEKAEEGDAKESREDK